jgi:hypothetical protein
VGEERVNFLYEAWGSASSDFGDITCVMPGVQFNAAGASGSGHGIDYAIADPERACVNSAKAQLLLTEALLTEDAAAARSIIQNYRAPYASIPEYLAAIDTLFLDKEAVVYNEDGSATVVFANE